MKQQTILIVEDNPITQKMIRVALETRGYQVCAASDGKTALELTAARQPDLVLQDLLLPDTDGFELVSRIRQLCQGREIPILAFSGFLSKMEQARSMEVGFTDYLFKPVAPSRLIEVVQGYLQPPRSVAPNAQGNGRHILVAHDDPEQLKMIRLFLGHAGFRVTSASDGAEALEKARECAPDAILSDVLMPRLDGFRLSLAVRLDPQLAGVPVVLVSAAYLEKEDRLLAETVGANALLFAAGRQEIIEALLASLEQGAPVVEHPAKLTEDYAHRVIRQLEQQVRFNSQLSQRLAVREAELSILAGVAETLKRTTDIQAISSELLHRSLDAAGASSGAVYLRDPQGQLFLQAQLGYSKGSAATVAGFFGHAGRLQDALESGEPLRVSPLEPSKESTELLRETQARSILIVPLTAGDDRLGVMAICFTGRDLGEDWVPFAKAVGSEIGQAIRLARALAGLKENEEKMGRILATMADGLVLSDQSGRITFANAAAERIFDLPAAEIMGRTCTDPAWKFTNCNGQPLAAEDHAFNSVMRTGEAVYNIEQSFERPDGRRLILSFNTAPLRDAAGSIIGTVQIARDITKRRQAEEALRRQSEELARYNAELEEFAYIAAHDLQEPLRTVTSFTQLLAQRYKGQLDAQAGQFINLAVGGAARMKQLIEDLLAYSRVARSEIARQQTDCQAAFAGSIENLRAAVEQSGAKVICDPLPTIMADQRGIQQIFQNLIGNALKFRGAAPPLVHVCAKKENGEWVFSVRDNGIGIDPHHAQSIFKIFTRLHARGEYPGTGIGLAVSKRIVERHHGRIWVESEPGAGATFYFTVPLDGEPGDEGPELAQDEPAHAGAAANAGGPGQAPIEPEPHV